MIPAAGWGTRLLPATKSQPKEMLPVVDRPAIQWVVEEAVAAGLDDILIVTGRWKRAIEDHFDRSVELEHHLRERGNTAALEQIERVSKLADLHYIRQGEQRGLGDAILCARKHVGDEPFAVLLGDDIVRAEIPCIRQLLRVYEERGTSVVAIEKVAPHLISRYGAIAGTEVREGLYRVDHLVEKPTEEEAPSRLAVMGRYILTPDIFEALLKTPPGKGGELQLTDGLNVLAQSSSVHALLYEGKRYDIGTKVDWLKANMELALDVDEFRAEVLQQMNDLLKHSGDA